jgi:curved DNA-binding protein CbpA
VNLELAKKIIGVSGVFDEITLKKTYRKKAKTLHPDKNKHPEAKQAFIELKSAHDFLLASLSQENKQPVIDIPSEKIVRKARARHQQKKRKHQDQQEQKLAYESYQLFIGSKKYVYFKIQTFLLLLLACFYVLDSTLPVTIETHTKNTVTFEQTITSVGGLRIQKTHFGGTTFYITENIKVSDNIRVTRSAVFNDILEIQFNDFYVKTIFIASKSMLPILIIALLFPFIGLVVKGPNIYFLMAVRWAKILIPISLMLILLEQARLIR